MLPINRSICQLCTGLLIMWLLNGCTMTTKTSNENAGEIVNKVDSLQAELDKMKKMLAPGLGELMYRNYIYVQNLSEEIENEKWDYAAFHLHEMEEIFETIINLHNQHDELVQPADSQLKTFIFPTFEKLEKAVEEKNKTVAKTEYINLKAGCNKCHVANNHAFIVIE